MHFWIIRCYRESVGSKNESVVYLKVYYELQTKNNIRNIKTAKKEEMHSPLERDAFKIAAKFKWKLTRQTIDHIGVCTVCSCMDWKSKTKAKYVKLNVQIDW